MEKYERCRQLPVLTTRTVKWDGEKSADGTKHPQYPLYDEEVHRWMELLYELDLTDRDYGTNIKKIKDRPIEQLTADEILTRMTWLIRGERFADGLIAEWLENGSLEALCRRLEALTRPVPDL